MKKHTFAAHVALVLLAANAGATTVRVHYDAGKDSIAILGDKGPMTWSKGAPADAAMCGPIPGPTNWATSR